MNSEFLKLDSADLWKGLIVAVFAAIATTLLPVLQSGALPVIADLKAAGITGLTAGVAYLLKNVLTNSNGEPLKKEG